MTTALLTVFAITFIPVIIFNVLYPRLITRLRTDHPTVWNALGSPRYIDLRPRRTAALLRFLLRRQYLAVADEPLRVLASRARASLIGAYAGIALIAVLMLFSVVGRT
jgi:hypothetical protein